MDLLATPTRRRALFALLYLSEGAPIGLVWIALPFRLRSAGAGAGEVASLVALLALPWAVKPLLAVPLDALRARGLAPRTWIVLAQLAMAATLLSLVSLGDGASASVLALPLLLHATAAAAQDVGIDTLAITTVPREERGRLNAWMQAGLRSGSAAFGGGALLLLASVGWTGVVVALLALLALVLVVVLACVPAQAGRLGARGRAAAPQPAAGTGSGAAGEVAVPPAVDGGERASGDGGLRAVLHEPAAWWALLFALVAGAGYEAAGGAASSWLSDQGLDAEQAGAFLLIVRTAGLVAGAFLGGFLADRVGHRRATGTTQVAFALGVLALAAFDAAGAPLAWRLATLGFTYLATGAFTAASYALLMDLCAPRVAATQFSTYMGATNACEAWANWALGRMQPTFGWAGAFANMALVSLAALPLVTRLRPVRDQEPGAASGPAPLRAERATPSDSGRNGSA